MFDRFSSMEITVGNVHNSNASANITSPFRRSYSCCELSPVPLLRDADIERAVCVCSWLHFTFVWSESVSLKTISAINVHPIPGWVVDNRSPVLKKLHSPSEPEAQESVLWLWQIGDIQPWVECPTELLGRIRDRNQDYLRFRVRVADQCLHSVQDDIQNSLLCLHRLN
jgi:hypothetical protein